MIPRDGPIPATARIRFTNRKTHLFIALLLVRFCSDLGATSFDPWRTPSARELGAEVAANTSGRGSVPADRTVAKPCQNSLCWSRWG